jgi:hypothetical protein
MNRQIRNPNVEIRKKFEVRTAQTASKDFIAEHLRTCLAWSQPKRSERGVYAAYAWQNSLGIRSARNSLLLKRPEDRAPALDLVEALTKYTFATRCSLFSCAGKLPTASFGLLFSLGN